MLQVVGDYLKCWLTDDTLVKYNMKTKEKDTKQFVSWDDAISWAQ